ncbi:MAG: VanZ family protein [Clostridia bacterium]|nr:VanZ family protein [Clostridia bacterium]
MKKIKVISYTITLCIMALIFFFSSQTRDESSALSSGLIMWFLNCVSVFSPIDSMEKLQFAAELSHVVRKCAHFTIYAALGASSAVSFRLMTGLKYRKIFFVTVIFCMIYAASDEIHQLFVSGRGGMITDVMIDTSGSAAGFVILMMVLGIKKCLVRRIDN